MRPILLTLVLVLCTGSALAQPAPDPQALWATYNAGDRESALAGALQGLETDPTDRDLHHLAGRCLADLGRNDEALPHLNHCIEGDVRDWRYAWSLFYVGGIHITEGRYAEARAAWVEVRDSRITANVSRSAAANLRFFGLDDAFADWPHRETDHLRILFSPEHADQDLDLYARAHEQAFATLTGIFDGGPAHPVRYIVWASEDEARQMAGITSLGFSKPEYNLIHCLWGQTRGHELTHVVAHHALHPGDETRFISEGVAVAFDLTDRDAMERARQAVRDAGSEVDLIELWTDPDSPAELIYPVGGAWIRYLVEREGMERVKDVVREQTVEHARAVYGEEFVPLVRAFEAEVNGN